MAIAKDFITRYGVYVQGSTAVTSSTAQTGALQVDGGIAVAKNLIVGQASTLWGATTLKSTLTAEKPVTLNETLSVTGISTVGVLTATGTLSVSGATSLGSTLAVTGATTLNSSLSVTGTSLLVGPLTANTSTFNGPVSVAGSNTFSVGTGASTLNGTLTVAGNAAFTSTTEAATTPAGAIVVSGGAYVGKRLIVASTDANTGTNTSNALYVAGGAWIDKTFVVSGDTTFRGNVTFNGTQTNVYSTNTVYTDNLLNLHTPSGSIGSDHSWTSNDGKDIGFMFHYYKTTDKDAFLGLSNSSGYLEFYSDSTETTASVVTPIVYGTFKTGSIILTDTTTATSTNTGALQVVGGIGVGDKIYAGGNISGGTVTARNLTQGRIVFVGSGGQLTDDAELTYDGLTNLLSADVTSANSATNIKNGGPGQLVYQIAASQTAFVATGTSGYILQANGASAPTWVPVSGVSAGVATTASNLANGTTGQIPYQNAAGSTTFFGPGNAGQLLVSNGAVSGGPSFVNTGNIFVGSALAAINISGGAAGQLPIQTGLNTTAFIPAGTAGQILQAQSGNTATFVSTSTLVVGTALVANKWTTARTVTFTGDTTGTFTIDGSADVTNVNLTIQPNSVALGTDTTGNYVGTGATSGFGISGSATGEGSAFTVTANSTSSNTTSTIVFRDASGNFSAGTITASLAGNATSADKWATARTLTLAGDLGGTATFDGSSNFTLTATIQADSVALGTDTTGIYVASGAVSGLGLSGSANTEGSTFTVTSNATSANTTSTLVFRDSSGNFSAGTITANLNGTATFATTATNLRDGTTGQIPYKTTASTTAFTGPGNAGEILTSRGAGQPLYQNTLTLAGTTDSAGTNSGALQVIGGVGIGKTVYVGGKVIVNDTTDSAATNQGAIQTLGGVGVAKDLTVGGDITVGSVAASTVTPMIFSNNLLIATYTSPAITTTATVNLDVFTGNVFRTAKYTVQIFDSGNTNIHVSEILVSHNNSSAYITEYAVIANNGILGSFDATYAGGSGNVTLTFTPTTVSSMVIKVARFGISA